MTCAYILTAVALLLDAAAIAAIVTNHPAAGALLLAASVSILAITAETLRRQLVQEDRS